MKPYPYLFAVAALSATLTHAHLLPPAQEKFECTYQDLTRAGSPVEKAACIYRDGLPPRSIYDPPIQPPYRRKRCTSIWITGNR